MAKSKGKKKSSKGKRPKEIRSDADAVEEVVASADASASFWSTADECAHYAALGCHIADIVRCKPPSKEDKPKSRYPKCATKNSIPPRQITCSEYNEMYRRAMEQYPWSLEIERFDPSDYHPEDIEDIPEVAMNDGEYDGDGMTLTLTNVTNGTTICFVTVFDVDLCDGDGSTLKSGISSVTTMNAADGNDGNTEGTGSTTNNTNERKCTTFIVLCPPQTFVHLCYLAPNQTQSSSTDEDNIPITSWSQVEIENDIQPWSYHPNVDDEHSYLLHFPFDGGEVEYVDASGRDATYQAYQCTQSEHGQLTHFFHGNYHALDFACPIGTPLYSPVNGVVVVANDTNKCNGEICSGDGRIGIEVSGIAAKNMFHWNSIMIRVDENVADTASETSTDKPSDPLFVELVHIQTNSCTVKVGDTVTKGQQICRSGSVGFSPEPHLHLAAYRSIGNDAATVRVRFECKPSTDGCDGKANGSGGDAGDRGRKLSSFLPRAGGWYNRSGLSQK